VVADRFSKRRIIITVQGLTAAVMAAVAVLSLTGAIELWHVGLASFAMGAGSAFFYPAYSAYLPKYYRPNNCSPRTGSKGLSGPRWGRASDPPSEGSSSGRSSRHRAVIVAASYAVAFVITLFLSRRRKPPNRKSSFRAVWATTSKPGSTYVARTRWLMD
jgi:DHA3 family tetracycline resistance protein-like MFS transporter